MQLIALILQWAVIQASAVYMQESPDYESANVNQTGMGKVVEILDRDRYWTKIRTPEPYEGWINDLCLVEVTEEQKDEYLDSPRYICTGEFTHIYSSPSEKAGYVSDFVMGNIVRQGPRKSGTWLEVILPSGKSGWVRKREVSDFREWAGRTGVSASGLADVARRFVGSAYVWGGMSPKGFDCSGLTGFCYFMNGILLPRDASQQAKCGEPVPVGEMRPGDLVFFGEGRISHVGLCIAPGVMVHSSQAVRVSSLVPGGPDYYGRNIISVRRILGHIDDGTGAKSIIASPQYFKQ